jgi:hypothetical protein
MATTITAGNATNGAAITSDNTGILELKTGTGAGTTALTLNASQAATVAGQLNLAAGTTTIAPLDFTAGTNLTTATAGAMEYDGKVIYATPQGTQRGVVPGAQFFRLNSDLAGANVNTAQNVFGVGVTLSASTVYAFEYVVVFSKSAGTTSHTFGLGFGGTATLNNIAYQPIWTRSATSLTDLTVNALTWYITTASNTAFGAATTTAVQNYTFNIKGTVSVNAGGTFIPQYTLSAAPGGAYTTAAGSYMLIYPIGASGANISVGTWA